MSKILDGKEVAKAIKVKVKEEALALKEKGIYPKLVVLRVGESKASMTYERMAIKVMRSVGIAAEALALPEESTLDELLQAIDGLNKDESIHGVIVMQPLPSHIRRHDIASHLDPQKDVDAMNPVNLGLLMVNDPSAMAPSTARAVIEILDHYHYELKGAEVCVIGSSPVVGKPLVNLLLNRYATVSNCRFSTRDCTIHTTKADIVISATGSLGLVGPEHITKGATVIDVGFGYKDGKPCGDVRFDEVEPIASAITPVPGGVGSVTTAVLALQTIKAAKMQNGILEA